MRPIPHNSPFKIIWNMVILGAILCFTYIITYRLIFRIFHPDAFYYLLNLLYLVDIVLCLFCTTKKGHIRLDTFPQIRSQYLRSWFVLDLLAMLPFELIPMALFPNMPTDPLGSSIYLGCQALTLIKVLKAVRIFGELQESMGISPGVRRLISFGYWGVQTMHLMALGWILIGASEAARTHFDQYIRAFYWVTTTIATIGYGDYYPNHDSNPQIVFTIVVQLLGVSMYSFIIANVSSLIANIDVTRANYLRRMEEVNAFLRSQKIPHDMQERVRDYYSYLWAEKRSISSTSVVEDLPVSLSIEILMHQNAAMVRQMEIFRDVDDLFIREAVKALTPRVFLPHEYIIRQGEYGDAMYFLSNGSLAVIIDGSEVARLGPGSIFGEAALVTDDRRNASIQALTYGSGYQLSKHDFKELRSRYPEFDQRVTRIVAERAAMNAHQTAK